MIKKRKRKKLTLEERIKMYEIIKRFIGKEEEQMYDPMLMRDMKEAAERVLDAVAAEERIIIYGDYDVDGVTSVSSL